jgi:hypothetical protein
MIRLIACLALAASFSFAPERAAASCEMNQMRASAAQILRRYNVQADVCTLTSGQLAAVRHIGNGPRSNSAKRNQIRSAVGGGSLGTLFPPR